MLPDVNVLVAAFRADHIHHAVAADWLQSTLQGADDAPSVYLPMHVLCGFIRLVTNSTIFPDAASGAQAIEFAAWLLAQPQVKLAGAASEWPCFSKLVLDKQLVANHIPDAWLASIAISLSEPFVTFDKGFRLLLPRSLLVLLPSTGR
jgi:uncharacterized protein